MFIHLSPYDSSQAYIRSLTSRRLGPAVDVDDEGGEATWSCTRDGRVSIYSYWPLGRWGAVPFNWLFSPKRWCAWVDACTFPSHPPCQLGRPRIFSCTGVRSIEYRFIIKAGIIILFRGLEKVNIPAREENRLFRETGGREASHSRLLTGIE